MAADGGVDGLDLYGDDLNDEFNQKVRDCGGKEMVNGLFFDKKLRVEGSEIDFDYFFDWHLHRACFPLL